jgi:hypothetical protein
MIMVTLPDKELGIEFQFLAVNSIHTSKKGVSRTRVTKSCVTRLYDVRGGDAKRPQVCLVIATGAYSYPTWEQNLSRDDLRKKSLASALKMAGINRFNRILVWMKYASIHRTHVPQDITLTPLHRAA